MSRASQRKLYNTFIKGLITEANEINFPEDASSDEVNFELLPNGSRRRRLGFDHDQNFDITVTNLQDRVFSTYKWEKVNGVVGNNILVVQDEEFIRLFNDTGETMTDNLLDFFINMTTDGPQLDTGASYELLVQRNPVEFSSGDGRLYVAGKNVKPFVIEYDMALATGSITVLEITERDFKGIDDSLDVEETPATLSLEHDYNLDNQGWGSTGGVLARSAYFAAKGVYPSNAMIWRHGKIIAPSTGIQGFNVTHFDSVEWGNTPAPKGHYVTNAFDSQTLVGSTSNFSISTWTYNHALSEVVLTIGAHSLIIGDFITVKNNKYFHDQTGLPDCSWGLNGTLNGTYSITAITGTTVKITYQESSWEAWCDQFFLLGDVESSGTSVITNSIDVRPSVVGFFSGRAFWSGVDNVGYSNKIWFSQIIDKEAAQAGKCFQVADPTAEFINELVDTDGGSIVIQDLGAVLKMVTVGASLIIIADNGLWEITGGEAGYFTAKSIRQNKISNIGGTGASSVIVADNLISYWSKQGIMIAEPDDLSGYKVSNITEKTIKTKFDAIPLQDAAVARGGFNDVQGRLIWLYATEGNGWNHRFNRVLIFDVKLNAIYDYSLPEFTDVATDDTYLVDLYLTSNYTVPENRLMFLCAAQNWFNSGWFQRDDYLDWFSTDDSGELNQGYLEAGYETLGEPALKKQSTYVTVFFKRTEENWIDNGSGGLILDKPSECILTGKWDWSDTNAAGKANPGKQVYNLKRLNVPISAGVFDNGFPVTKVKVKVRGRGDALTLRFETTDNNHCYILGWANNMTGNTTE